MHTFSSKMYYYVCVLCACRWRGYVVHATKLVAHAAMHI